MKTPRQILSEYWGFSSFKSKQEEIINSVLNGKDTLGLLPTGGGKSICYQIPALVNEGICIVISPLVSLITDQSNNLKNKGLKTLSLVGGLSFDDLQTLLDNAIYGNYKFLFLSPERLQQEIVQNAIKQMNVNLIAVDEAHCISQWGNDFRPAYKNIVVLRELHPLIPIIALTATATPVVLADTIRELKMELPLVCKDSFVRSNLSYQIQMEEDKLYRTEQLLKNCDGASIVYTRSRKGTVETSNHLNNLGLNTAFYHGGLSSEEKKERLEQWQNGTIDTIVATNAFGMGIDKANVRVVIHIQLPESIESYFQEAGRAGRDAMPAKAVLIYNEYDKTLIRKQFIDSLPSPMDLKKLYRTLNNYFQIPYGEGEFVQNSFSFANFCKTYQLNSLYAYNGLNALDRLGVIQLSKEFGRKSTLRFVVSSEVLLDYFEKNILASVVGKTILRIYGGIFEAPTKVNLDLISSKTQQAISEVIETLEKMEAAQLLELSLQTTDASITFLVPREDDKTINKRAKEIEVLNENKKQKVNDVLAYVINDSSCRSEFLVKYFGEETSSPCGICSYCQAQDESLSKSDISKVSEKIIKLLKENEMSSREISEKSIFTEAKVLAVLKLLLDAEKVGLNEKNEYKLI